MIEYSVYYSADKPIGDFINAMVSIIINKFTGRLLVINKYIVNWNYVAANRHSQQVKSFIELALFEQSNIFIYNYPPDFIGDILISIGGEDFSQYSAADVEQFKTRAVTFEIVNRVYNVSSTSNVGDEINIVLDPKLLTSFGTPASETIIGLIYYKLQTICRLIHIAPIIPKINLFKQNESADCRIRAVNSLLSASS